jgi:hypothetical protein
MGGLKKKRSVVHECGGLDAPAPARRRNFYRGNSAVVQPLAPDFFEMQANGPKDQGV